jgi:hypothetical protein
VQENVMHTSTRLSIGAIVSGAALVLSIGASSAFAEEGHGGRNGGGRDGRGSDDGVAQTVTGNPAPRVDNDVNDDNGVDRVDNDVNDDND